MGKCEIKKCREPESLTFYGHAVCEKHYAMDGKDGFDLKEKFGIKDKVVAESICICGHDEDKHSTGPCSISKCDCFVFRRIEG